MYVGMILENVDFNSHAHVERDPTHETFMQ